MPQEALNFKVRHFDGTESEHETHQEAVNDIIERFETIYKDDKKVFVHINWFLDQNNKDEWGNGKEVYTVDSYALTEETLEFHIRRTHNLKLGSTISLIPYGSLWREELPV